MTDTTAPAAASPAPLPPGVYDQLPADAIAGLLRLRREVPENLVGKLPRVTCRDCKSKSCRNDGHKPFKCPGCGGWLPPHMHLDYVGHAETTSELLEADLAWNWEPLAFGEDGLPKFDADGGLWIRLTVCGITRLGYGTADNASGFKAKGDVRKEIIGDAIRNAAMRFGFALNLWAKTDIHERTPQEDPQPAAHNGTSRWSTKPVAEDEFAARTPEQAAALVADAQRPRDEQPKANDKLVRDVNIELAKHGITDRAGRLKRVSELVGHAVQSTKELTVAEAAHVLRRLAAPDVGGSWSREQADQLAADLLAELNSASSDPERVEIATRVASAVKAGKITPEDRETLLAVYQATHGGGRAKASIEGKSDGDV